jgi:thioredoxin-dependent peroxiredoxin
MAVDVILLSDLRKRDFGSKYGIGIVDGPISGLLARTVIILDENGKVKYSQLVPEIAQEPDYEAVLQALKN